METETSKPTLLMLHGFTGSPASWDAVSTCLGSRYRLIRPYLPGHHPDDTTCPDFDGAGSHIAALLSALPKPRTLMGYSLGGRLALYTTIHYPHLVDRLILESATAGIADDAERAARKGADDQLAQNLRTKGLSWFVEYWETLPLFESHKNLPEPVRAAQRKQRLAHTTEGLAQSLERMGAGVMPSLWGHLQHVTCPVRLITGTLDVRYTTIAREMISHLPHARHILIPNAGHSIHLEQPQLLCDAILH
jgi:2-succinyl-6-hydroxy-2,4-cyclohexadiene-1-carboxylate synthase